MSLRFSYGQPARVKLDADLKASADSFADGQGAGFLVRGPEYLSQKGSNMKSLKQPSEEALYECIGANIFRTSFRLENSGERVGDFRRFLVEHGVDKGGEEADMPKFLVMCWHFSNFLGSEHTLVQHVFVRKGFDPVVARMMRSFLESSDKERHGRLKYLFNVVDGPSVMVKAVEKLGGSRPVLIGSKLTTKYFSGPNYLEVDMDVGSSMVASMLNTVRCS